MTSRVGVRVARWILVLATLVGLTSGLVATPYPWVARADGDLQFPALAAWVGGDVGAPPAGHASWREFGIAVPAEGDWVLLAPIPFGPDEVFADRIGAGPSSLHVFGNDDTGRDVAARLVHGARTAVWTAVSVVVLAGVIGVALGAWAGIARGAVDFCVLRWIELTACFPALLLILCIVAFVDAHAAVVPLVLAGVYQATFARVIRSDVMSLREREWFRAARHGLGVTGLRFWFRHLWPQLQGRVATTAAFVAAGAIVAESTLRFLGLGGIDAVSWGELVAQFRATGMSAWHVWTFPCIALGVVVLALHTLASATGGEREVRREVGTA